MAPAGVTVIIIRKSAIGKVSRAIPTMMNYKTHVDKESMFNTPPVLPIFSALQTLKYYKEVGGIAAIQKLNQAKAELLYNEIDSNPFFKGTVTCKEDRSLMNICFVMADGKEALEEEFSKLASSKGHRRFEGTPLSWRFPRFLLQRAAHRKCTSFGGLHARVRSSPLS